jgi:CDP-diglyceride synthetase
MRDPMTTLTAAAVATCAALVVWLTSQMAITDEKAVVLATLGIAFVTVVVALLGGLFARRPGSRRP